MGENTKIEWAHHTFNPWIGCQKVSDGCANCYAEQLMDKRMGKVQWGPGGTRVRTSESNWKQPLKWDREAATKGIRYRVFCASLADVFEDREELHAWREDLFKLILATPNLDWLVLTKRPENIQRLHRIARGFSIGHNQRIYGNLWIGTSVENQEQADKRIPELLKIPAKVRFLSCEPLLGPVDLENYVNPTLPIPLQEAPDTWADWNSRGLWPHWVPEKWRRNIEEFHLESWGRGPKGWLQSMLRNRCPSFGAEIICSNCIGEKDVTITGRFVHTWNNMCILVDTIGIAHVTSTPKRHLFDPGPSAGSYQKINWVIVGGESGPSARPMHPEWARSLRDQCQAAGVPFLFKQWGEWIPEAEYGKDFPAKLTWGNLERDGFFEPFATTTLPRRPHNNDAYVVKVGKHAAGRELDGRTWDEVPEVHP